MRALVAYLTATACLLAFDPVASAMSSPMSEEQLTQASHLIVYGEITEVTCNGDPSDNGQVLMTPYLATLTIDEVVAPEGEDITSVTLPFATMVYYEGTMPPSCSWSPSYLVGEKGLYYLATGSSTEFYTLVSWNAFVADEDSMGEELPTCEGGDTPGSDAGPMPLPDGSDGGSWSGDAGGSEGDTVEVGPEPDTNPDDVQTSSTDAASTTTSTGEDAGPAEDAAAADAMLQMQCEPGEECDMCGTCTDQGQCMSPPSCPICTSDSDCAEGETCSWIDSVTSECVSEGDSGSEAESDTEGSSGGGGCATGSAGGPLSALVALFALMAFARRRRVLTVPVPR